MIDRLPSILIDGIPFILNGDQLLEWRNQSHAIHKEDLHDEGDYFWMVFDRNTRSPVKGSEQFEKREDLIRVLLRAGIFNRALYKSQVQCGLRELGKRWGYQLLSESLAVKLVGRLDRNGIKQGDPGLHLAVKEMMREEGLMELKLRGAGSKQTHKTKRWKR